MDPDADADDDAGVVRGGEADTARGGKASLSLSISSSDICGLEAGWDKLRPWFGGGPSGGAYTATVGISPVFGSFVASTRSQSGIEVGSCIVFWSMTSLMRYMAIMN